MRLSVNNGSAAIYTGYGHATMKIIKQLGILGHSVLINRSAPVEFTYSHPDNFRFFNENAYKIGYTAWESTWMQDGWQEGLDSVNELWVANKFNKDIFSQYTDKEIYVFPHGIDEVFSPIERKVEDKVKFLHVGFPAYRKNVHDTVNTFLELYAGRKDVELTIKAYAKTYFPINEPNIKFVPEHMTYADLVKLMGDHHAMFYPSWGEGFGFIPLQALGTGLPVIQTDGWCDYKHHCPELVIDSELSYSPWQMIHPGKMFKPDLNHFANLILDTEKNIEEVVKRQYDRAPAVHEEYNWLKVVKDHFESVEARLMV